MKLQNRENDFVEEKDNWEPRPPDQMLNTASGNSPSAAIALPKGQVSPIRVLFILLGGIFLSEIVAMAIVFSIEPLPYRYVTIIDASIMLVLIFPIVYFFSLRPLIRFIRKSQQAEHALQELNETLEQRVVERTKELRESEERYRSTLDNMMEGCQILDFDWRYIYVNDTATNHTHLSKKDLLGSTIMEVYPGIEQTDMFGFLRRSMQERTTHHTEHEFTYPDGSQSFFKLSIQPVPEGIFILTIDITARVEAEKKIVRAKKQWEQTFDSVPDLIAILDNKHRIIRANKAMADSLGMTLKQAVGQTCFECVHGLNEVPAFCPHSKLLADGQEHQADVHEERLGGDFIVTVSPIYDDNGQLIGSVHIAHDITERKQAEEALRQSQEDLDRAQQVGQIGSWRLDVQKNVLTWSDETYHIFGIPKGTPLSYETFLNTVHPDDRQNVDDQWNAGLRGEPYDIEHRIVVAGEFKWVREKAYLEIDSGGNLLGGFGIVQDITKRRQAEDALRSARDELERRVQERTKELAVANQELKLEIYEREEIEQQLRIQTTAMEAAANGIIITNSHGEILWANPALTEMTGYTQDELIGENTRLFKSGEHEPNYYYQMWATIKAGNVWHGETKNRRKDGSIYIEEQTITPIRDEHNQIAYFIAIKQDVTEQKRAEEELEKRNQELQILSASEHTQRLVAETLRDATIELTKSLDLDTVLNTLLKHVAVLVETDIASIGFVEDESHVVARNWTDSNLSPIFPIDIKTDSFFQKIANSHKSLIVQDATQEQDWIDYPGIEPIRSWLGVPILVNEMIIGTVLLGKLQAGFFTDEHVRSVEALVSQAAVAIQNAWLFEQVRSGRERLQMLSRRLVEKSESERRYIARELHDQAGQSLTSLILGLGQLEKVDEKPDRKQTHVMELKQLANDIQEDLHRLAVDLRPASLDHLGLIPALEQLVNSYSGNQQMKFKFKAVGLNEVDRLPAETETSLYRIVQEALTNVVRHAQATRADVLLEKREDALILIIEDNGVGFDASVPPDNDHLGLIGIRERAEMLGGNLTIESIGGSGTTIVVEVSHDNSHFIS